MKHGTVGGDVTLLSGSSNNGFTTMKLKGKMTVANGAALSLIGTSVAGDVSGGWQGFTMSASQLASITIDQAAPAAGSGTFAKDGTVIGQMKVGSNATGANNIGLDHSTIRKLTIAGAGLTEQIALANGSTVDELTIAANVTGTIAIFCQTSKITHVTNTSSATVIIPSSCN